MDDVKPSLLVFSSLFPGSTRPHAGLFIRERLRQTIPRVSAVVVSPQPWFPFQSLLRRLRPGYRTPVPRREIQDGLEVYAPRFLALPGIGRRFDGFMMALCSFALVRRLARTQAPDLIDAHFAYPDGYAASLLARWFDLPLLVTLRGTETRLIRSRPLRRRLLLALARADRVVVVANSLKHAVVSLGADPDKIERVGNGVDTERFLPVDRAAARERLGLPCDVPVLVSVGGLVPRKGFHRVIERIPALRERYPDLRYLIIGGASPEGDYRAQLEEQVRALGLEETVVFLGAVEPRQLREPLSAADVFVLSTANEGWANVFLEAMACGLPVVTTRVGGNPEVVENETLGRIVPPDDGPALQAAIEAMLANPPDRAALRRHAQENAWGVRAERLVAIYSELKAGRP